MGFGDLNLAVFLAKKAKIIRCFYKKMLNLEKLYTATTRHCEHLQNAKQSIKFKQKPEFLIVSLARAGEKSLNYFEILRYAMTDKIQRFLKIAF